MALLAATVYILVKSEYSLTQFLTAAIVSYYCYFAEKVCPKRKQVTLRYFAKNWHYMLFSLLAMFELLIIIGYLQQLYNGYLYFKPFSSFVGHAGLSFVLAYILFDIEKKKHNVER